jgi:serine/threonine protein kinase
MPAPATLPEFLDLVQRSGVADEAKMKAYLEKAARQGGLPAEPTKAAGHLVRDGLLTYFQAEQLLQGKWKRFNIGKYKVLERLGSGGMGQVFLCEHKLMRRRVAVKVLPTAKAADQASLDRFNREARAAAAVDHPNIVRAFDIDQDDNLHFLVMEYVDGTNLQDLIKKTGPLDPVRACHYVYAASVGLQHAHEMGLIHRDIKPGNILLDRVGVVKILDMGLARLIHDTEDHITRKYDENILGTADYLSPEQAEDSHTVDIRSDIYSLGATFYYLLSGSQPFPEGTIPQKLIWHRTRHPRSLRELRPDVSDEIVAVVNKMMAKRPADRYQTPAEVAAALQPWASVPIAPPDEREMPQLSPAVAGPQAAARAAAALRTATAPTTVIPGVPGSGVRLASSPSMAHVAADSPTLPADSRTAADERLPEPPGQAVWESLGDAQAAAAGDTGRAGHTVPESMPRRDRQTPPRRPSGPVRKLPLVLSAVGLVVLLAGGLGVYLAFFRSKPEDNPTPPAQLAPRRLVVSKAKAAEGAFPTLGEAVRRAGSGDTVAVEEPTLQEAPLRIAGRRDLTIESALPDGRPVLFQLTSAASPAAAIELANAEGVRLRGFVVDAQGGADFAVQLSGNLAGTTLDGFTVQGGRKGGVRLLNAAGQPGKPVVIDHVRAVLTAEHEAGVKVEAGTTLTSRGVAVRRGRFEGPGKAGVRFEGAVDGAEVTHNRFYQLDAAVTAARPGDRQSLRADVSHNTVVGCKFGLLVTGPPGGSPVIGLTVNRNYFVRVSDATAQAEGDLPGVSANQNGRDADSRPGNVNLNAQEVTPAPGFSTNAADDGAFLRFAGGGPTVGGKRVGAE